MSRPGPAVVLGVQLASWEIECCVPPPAVGEEVHFWLTFTPGGDLAVPRRVEVTHPAPHDVRLTGGGFTAQWYSAQESAPPPGPALLTGELHAQWHGSDPEGPNCVRGRVRRVQVVSCILRWHPTEVRTLVAVPGTTELAEVTRAPARPEWPPRTEGGTRTARAMLLDLEVDSRTD